MKQTVTRTDSLFSAGYWKAAGAEFRSIRSLSVSAILCAIAIAIEWVQIPLVPGILNISFSFLAIALCSLLTGPLMAIFCGIVVDIVGFLIPIGTASAFPFFPGYTLTAVLTAVIFALFLYRARPSFARIALSRGIIDLFINVLLGSVWRMMTGGVQSYPYNVMLSGVKNLAMFPIEVLLLCLFLRAMQKPLAQLGFVSKDSEFEFRMRDILLLFLAAVIGIVLLFVLWAYYDEIKTFIKSVFIS